MPSPPGTDRLDPTGKSTSMTTDMKKKDMTSKREIKSPDDDERKRRAMHSALAAER